MSFMVFMIIQNMWYKLKNAASYIVYPVDYYSNYDSNEYTNTSNQSTTYIQSYKYNISVFKRFIYQNDSSSGHASSATITSNSCIALTENAFKQTTLSRIVSSPQASDVAASREGIHSVLRRDTDNV